MAIQKLKDNDSKASILLLHNIIMVVQQNNIVLTVKMWTVQRRFHLFLTSLKLTQNLILH